jgi:hypothetical protein
MPSRAGRARTPTRRRGPTPSVAGKSIARPAAVRTEPSGPPAGQATFMLDVPFAERSAALAAGAAWDQHAQTWTYAGARLPAALRPYRSLPYSWERWQEEERNGARVAPHPGTGEIVLREHQIQATALGLRARQLGRSGFVIADEVGVGKTYAALNLVLKTNARDVLVVCPLGSVRSGGRRWRRWATAASASW